MLIPNVAMMKKVEALSKNLVPYDFIQNSPELDRICGKEMADEMRAAFPKPTDLPQTG